MRHAAHSLAARPDAGRNPSSSSRLGPGAGLTLIEVLLALLILGIGLSILVATTAKCLSVARKARNFETARHLLDRVDLEEPFDPDEEGEGSVDGTFDPPFEGFRWTRESRPAGEDPEDRFYELKTRIVWADRGRDAYEEVVTYRYAPEEGGTGSVTRTTSATGSGGSTGTTTPGGGGRGTNLSGRAAGGRGGPTIRTGGGTRIPGGGSGGGGRGAGGR